MRCTQSIHKPYFSTNFIERNKTISSTFASTCTTAFLFSELKPTVFKFPNKKLTLSYIFFCKFLKSKLFRRIMVEDERRYLILTVDDEPPILDLVEFNLLKNGYRTLTAQDGETAVKLAREKQPDAIILDLMLPGIDGMEVCKRLKSDTQTHQIPIIMLTARGEEEEIVKGLEHGADDYVTKPFSPRVLLARLKSVLRRTEQKKKSPKILEYHSIRLDPGRRKVSLAGREIKLTFTEFEILSFLLRHPGWVFSRSDIVDNVHGDNYPVTERSVDVQIVGLRKKLGAAGKYIETVRGVGYRLKEAE